MLAPRLFDLPVRGREKLLDLRRLIAQRGAFLDGLEHLAAQLPEAKFLSLNFGLADTGLTFKIAELTGQRLDGPPELVEHAAGFVALLFQRLDALAQSRFFGPRFRDARFEIADLLGLRSGLAARALGGHAQL